MEAEPLLPGLRLRRDNAPRRPFGRLCERSVLCDLVGEQLALMLAGRRLGERDGRRKVVDERLLDVSPYRRGGITSESAGEARLRQIR